jgi:tetratricopeptide (TPR) repeat protein
MYTQATQPGTELSDHYSTSRELIEETKKLEKKVNENDTIPGAYLLFAQILNEQENYEKAEGYYKKASQKDPKNSALIVHRALNIMTWKNQFDEAIEMLNEALTIDVTCELAYETLAAIELQK